MSQGVQRLSAGEARLLTATAKAQNTRVLLDVVDESLRRAEELRLKRQAEEAERHEIEARIERRRETEEAERRDAERVARESDAREAAAFERAALREGDERAALVARQAEREAQDAITWLDVLA